MSVLENPFFVREVRAYSRKAWSPLSWFLLAASALPLFPLWLDWKMTGREGATEQIWFRGLLLGTVALSHAVLCGFAGWQLGSRVFGTEQRRHTLEGLRLVSTSPWIWVLQKLAFPLYFLLLIWLAVVPGCLALVIRGAFLPLAIMPGLVLAGCAGLMSFAGALIVPPERIGLPRSAERALPLAERLEISALRLVASWMSWLMLKLAFVWLTVGAQNQPVFLIPRSLFGRGWLREDYALGLLLMVYVGCAVTAAWEWANPSSPTATRLRSTFQRLTIAAGYLLLVGLTWENGHWVWRSIIVGVPVLQGLQLWREQRKIDKAAKAARRKSSKEDPRSAREIQWIQNRWDNPVLIRDLRVGLRGNALVWIFLRQGVVMAMIGVGMAALIFGGPWAPPASYALETFASSMATILGWISFVSLMRIGTRASNQWAAERRMNTIPQLLLSPISARDVVNGRWAATLIEGITAAFPWAMGFGLFVVATGLDEGLGIVLSVSLWLGSLALLLSMAQTAGFRPLRRWRDWLSAHAVALGLFIGQPFLFIWGLGAFDGGETPFAVLVGLTIMNVVALPLLLWGASRNLETHRNQSLE